MKKIIFLVTLFICFSLAIPTYGDTKNVKSYNFENDIKMTGVISSSEKFFFIDENWIIDNLDLNLVITKSELLDVDYSTITILINDTPINSNRLDGDKEYKKSIKINIPKEIIQEGFNKITVKAYKTITDKVCRDDSNIANWLILHKESNINIQYSYKASQNNISEFNNIFLREDNGLRLTTTILLPDNYSSEELSASMMFNANFGKIKRFQNFKFDLTTYSNIKNTNDNIIYIGKPSNTNEDLLKFYSQAERDLLDNNCIIKLVDSPFNKNSKMLILLSNDDKLLLKASKLMTSNKLVDNLNKDTITINSDTDVLDLEGTKNYKLVYLSDLGYDNLMVKGPFSQEINFDLKIPKDKLTSDGSSLKFNIRYAENLDFDRSLMTVYLNDKPIGSKKLSLQKASNDVFEAIIPKELLGENYYSVKVIFNLLLKDVECVTREIDNPWAYVSSDSYLKLNFKNNEDMSFENYPYPFIHDSKFNNIKLIVPDMLTIDDLRNLSNIVAYIGRDIENNTGEIEVVKASVYNSKDYKGNIIVYGTPNNNKILKDINNSLNIKFSDDFKMFESNDIIKFIGEYPSEIGTVQLIKNPYDNDFGAMVVSAVNDTDLSLATKYLSDLSLTTTLKGDAVTIDRNGQINDLRFKVKVDELKKEEIKVSIDNESKIFISVAFVLLLTMVIAIALLIKKYKKK